MHSFVIKGRKVFAQCVKAEFMQQKLLITTKKLFLSCFV